MGVCFCAHQLAHEQQPVGCHMTQVVLERASVGQPVLAVRYVQDEEECEHPDSVERRLRRELQIQSNLVTATGEVNEAVGGMSRHLAIEESAGRAARRAKRKWRAVAME